MIPKLSIITVNLNNSNGLNKTIESVINQDFIDFEYIIIDGGSTDGSVELIKKNAYKLGYWISEPDTGIYSAMNKGIMKANGMYCLFLNSGDYLYNNRSLTEIFSYNFNEDIVYGDQYIEKNGVREKSLFLTPEFISFRSFINSTIPHQCSFIKRSLFKKIGLYNENKKIISDWEFILLALFKCDCTLRKIEIPISLYDIQGISSNPEFARAIELEKQDTLYKHFPRFMMDIEAIEAFEKSKTYKLVNSVRKFINK